MKKSLKIIITLLIIIAIVGVVFFVILKGSKKALTIEKFEEIANKKGYKIAEVQNQLTSSEDVISAKAAIKEDDSYLINFYVLKDNDVAKNFYNGEKEKYSANKKEGDNESQASKDNYENYTLKTDKVYSYIARVSNTVIRLKVDEAKEQEVRDFIKELGY